LIRESADARLVGTGDLGLLTLPRAAAAHVEDAENANQNR
jgi:hypothetical protein